jgi:hypothetical protein
MALFIRQDDERSELQQRLAAELRDKAKARAEIENTPPDGVDDSRYLKDTKVTTSLAWVWAIIVLLGLIAVVVIIIKAHS